ncbi:MAG: hypothetical protein ABR559_05925 [Gemmatimonadota bacterium]
MRDQEDLLRKIQWVRVLLCGLVAGGIMTLLAVALLAFIGDEFLAAIPGKGLNDRAGSVHLFLLFINLATGVWALWLYTAIRPRYGPGPKTAAVAGVAWWVIVSLQSARWVALVGIPPAVVLAPLAGSLIALLVVTVIGSWLYER